MGLGQWWGLQELVSRCPGRFLCSELDHSGGGHFLCQSLKGTSASSWVYLYLHSICNVHRNPFLSAVKCDWHCSIPQYLKRKCIVVPIRKQAEAAEAEPLDNDSLPDRLLKKFLLQMCC